MRTHLSAVSVLSSTCQSQFNTENEPTGIMYKMTISLANDDRAKNVITGDVAMSMHGTLGSFVNAPISRYGYDSLQVKLN